MQCALQILTSRPRTEWVADVASRYRALAQFSKDDARIQYLRIIRSLPYVNSIFFTVKVRAWPAGAGGRWLWLLLGRWWPFVRACQK